MPATVIADRTRPPAGMITAVRHRLPSHGYRYASLLLLGSTFLLHAEEPTALAQALPRDKAAHHNTPPAKPAAPNTKPSAKTAAVETVDVSASRHDIAGGGLLPQQTVARAQSSVTADFINRQSPTTNTLSLIATLPGAVVSNSDPLGISDRSSISIRGMNGNEIGFLFEGMPAADAFYNLPDTSEWADSENIGRIDVAQGSAALAAPVYNSVGGTVTQELIEPSDKMGGHFDFSLGNHMTNKDFLRFDSGTLGKTGIRTFTSFSYTTNNNWRGPGTNNRYHVDFKAVKEWGAGNSAHVVVTYNRAFANKVTNPSLAQWKKNGISYNYSGTYTPGATNYYGLFGQLRSTMRISAPIHLVATRNVSFDITPYYMWMSGAVDSGTQLSDTGSYNGTQAAGALGLDNLIGGKATVASVAGYAQYTTGVYSALNYNTKYNDFSVGYWYSNLTQNSLTSYVPLSADGTPSSMTGKDPITTANGNVLASKDLHFWQNLHSFFIRDTVKLLHDRLELTGGFKLVYLDRTGTNELPGAPYKISSATTTYLPRFEALFHVDRQNDVFFDANTNFSAPTSDAAYFNSYNISTGKVAVTGTSNLKNEYAISEELGFRHRGFVNASISLFNYNFTNKQISTSTYISGALTTAYLNAGGQTTRGVSAEVALRPWHHIAPYLSGQYLHARLDNDINVGGYPLPTSGKVAPLSPKFVAAIGLAYDDGRYFGDFNFSYIDSQYSTFMDDESIAARKTANVSLGYRFKDYGRMHDTKLQLNLINIGDSKYLSGVFSMPTNAKAVTVQGHTITGSTPTYYVGGAFAVVGGFSTGF
ncbi:MAG: TonB-dependent receptor plug domain-containing protein [Gluconacetobacter sp.]